MAPSSSVRIEEVVPWTLVELAPILRVSNEVEATNPRVAYLCRHYAWEKAHRLDPTSRGRGVRQFKKELLQRLERDKDLSIKSRVKQSDAREVQFFYRNHYRKYIYSLQKGASATTKAEKVQITKDYKTAVVLYEVLKAVNNVSLQLEPGQPIPDETYNQNHAKEKKEVHASTCCCIGLVGLILGQDGHEQ